MDSKVYMKKSLGDTGLDLLEELCNICDDNRIDYYLAPKMVLRSVFDLSQSLLNASLKEFGIPRGPRTA